VSSGLAIAGVTAVLQRLITDGLGTDFQPTSVPTFTVTALPPNRVLAASNGADVDQLNLFLYQVTPNAGWRNVALPSRGEDGERRSNPPLALDLHYLLTAYGAQLLNAEILLGCAMQALHELPFLTRDNVRKALTVGTISGTALDNMLIALSASGLAEQIEQIKITPQPLNTEEMSKLWTAFQAPYRPTAGYLATVVLIESHKPTRPTLPVRERIVKVVPFQRPTIDKIESVAGAADPIMANSTIVIKGRDLRGAITSVVINGNTFIPAPNDPSADQIKINLSPVPSGGVLRAGIQGVQVVHEIDLGKPPVAHRGVESNVAAFVLHPALTAPVFPTNASGSFMLTFDPPVGRSQRVTLLLSEKEPSPHPPASAFSIAAPPENGITAVGQTETAAITFSLANVDPGDYLVRVQVDGAESSLVIDSAGHFSAPIVTITSPPPPP
jgi:uncharacterized protein DUF4255